MMLPFRAPNLNAFAERFIQTLRHECLDRFVVVGTEHMDYLNSEFVDYYNRQRPHSALEKLKPPEGQTLSAGWAPPGPGRITCERRLGGVIKHYRRAA